MDPNILAAIAQQIAQLNALIRQGAGQGGDSYYAKAVASLRSFFNRTGLAYRPATINLSVQTLTGTNVSGGNDDFRIAQTEDFILHEMRGFMVANNQDGEANAPASLSAGAVALDPYNRALAKALNARVTVQNKDTKVPFMENEGIGLASIMPEVGGRPLRFGPEDAPVFVVPRNTTVELVVALQDTAAFFTQASTNYGVALVGGYVSPAVNRP